MKTISIAFDKLYDEGLRCCLFMRAGGGGHQPIAKHWLYPQRLQDCKRLKKTHDTHVRGLFFLLGETRNGCKSPAEGYISAHLKENR